MSDTQAHPRILIADDSKVIRHTFKKYLAQEFDLVEAEDGVQALKALEAEDHGIALIFTDIGMPNLDGFGLIQQIRQSDRAEIKDLPIVVVTGADESEGVGDKASALGATDLIRKPFSVAEVKSRTNAYAKYTKKVHDLEEQQPRDPFTGLSKKDYFQQQGQKAVSFARHHGHEVTVVRMAIDDFQGLTAKLGKGVMGKIIKLVADIFKKNLRQEDDACWLGGSQFALALPGTDPGGAEHALRRVREKTANFNLKIGGQSVHVGFSTGVTSRSIDEDGVQFADLLKEAEGALKRAMQGGGGKTVRAQEEGAPAAAPTAGASAVNIEEILTLLAEDKATRQQLASAMRKFMPILERGDQELKLGLGKVIQHLDRRLPK